MGSLRKEVQSRARNLFKIGLIRHRPGTWQMLQTNRVCTFLVPSPNPTKQLSNDLLQLNFQTHTLNTHGQVEAIINLPVHEPQEPGSRNNVTNDAHVANNIMQEQQQLQYTPPSTPVNFGMQTQLNAPNTARQLSQATMHFDGLQLDHQFPRRSSMPGQLNLVSPQRSPPLNTLVNAPLALNPQQAHINVPAPHPPF